MITTFICGPTTGCGGSMPYPPPKNCPHCGQLTGWDEDAHIVATGTLAVCVAKAKAEMATCPFCGGTTASCMCATAPLRKPPYTVKPHTPGFRVSEEKPAQGFVGDAAVEQMVEYSLTECPHHTVAYGTVRNARGLMVRFWSCVKCGTQFVPSSPPPESRER